MLSRTIPVKILKESSNKVHLRFLSSNSKMIVNRDEFEERIEAGEYQVK